MRRRKLQPISALAVLGIAVALGAAACGQSEGLVARGASDPPAFGNDPDASADGASNAPDVAMCPVTTCMAPRTTCPSSKFPCDTDLTRDDQNCGACGVRCGDGSTLSSWHCVQGKCTFGCTAPYANCDGDPTNGCETALQGDDDNCGDCGNKCAEGLSCYRGTCINFCVRLGKPDRCGADCVSLARDDLNCGACGAVCPAADPSKPSLPLDMYYGCANATCGNRKCKTSGKADCNDDVSDGCETTIHTNEHCIGCNDACDPGKQCARTIYGTYFCACEDSGETLCGNACIRLDDDPENCGGCGRVCPGVGFPHVAATCNHGVCVDECATHYADCDGVSNNGCEVDIRVDNRNCGGCGIACEPDQVCAEGKCLVAPCDAGQPETTAK